MASRDINHAHPALREFWPVLVRLAWERHRIRIFLTATYRSNAEQARLYAQGRTAPGPVVTNARPGTSAHNVAPPEGSHALDFGVYRADGSYEDRDTRPYRTVSGIVRELGAMTGADFRGFTDLPHVELPGWKPGRVYGQGYRFMPAKYRAGTVPSVPALPPKPAPATVPARIVMLENLNRAGWTRMDAPETVYHGHSVVRLPGGDVTVTKLSSAPSTAGLRLEYRTDGQLWIARIGGNL